jgi:MFS family permease
MRAGARLALRSLGVRNYRLYFVGQIVSIAGSWMQLVAMAWLVLRLTGSAFDLGVTTALQTAPYLVLSVWGGLVADRVSKRRLLICTQVLLSVPAFLLWALTETGKVQIWMVWALVMLRGVVNSFDNPARQSFVNEMVGRERIVNAVSLNASVMQAGRLLGPAAAAVIIATAGLAPCFFLNGASFLVMVVMLLLMRRSELTPAPPAARGKGLLREGLRYVARTPNLRLPLGMMAVVGLLAFNFTVVLPAVARFAFDGGATTYALMVNFLAAGALAAALVSGTRSSVSSRIVALSSIAFGIALGLSALVANLAVFLVAMTAVGFASVMFSASVQSAVQLEAPPEMRGRILSLYQIVYMGTTPLGALLVGALASTAGSRSGLVVGAVGALAAGIVGLWSLTRKRDEVPRPRPLDSPLT